MKKNKINRLKEELQEKLAQEKTKLKNLRAEFAKKKDDKLAKKIRENLNRR